MLALEKEQQSFPRNTQYLLSFHAYRKWFDCNNRRLSGTGMEINRKRGPTPWLLSVCYGCLNHLQLFSTPRTENAGREIVGAKVSLELSLPVFSKKQMGSCLYIIISLGRIQLLKC
jgi:hypothetical protein